MTAKTIRRVSVATKVMEFVRKLVSKIGKENFTGCYTIRLFFSNGGLRDAKICKDEHFSEIMGDTGKGNG